MAPWDDVEVDSDGDELNDWLWDVPERYDVGSEDEPTARPGWLRTTPAEGASANISAAGPGGGGRGAARGSSRRRPTTGRTQATGPVPVYSS